MPRTSTTRCKDHFGWPWADPILLGQALVDADLAKHGPGSHILAGVRYYTGIHDSNRRPDAHGKMQRRLQAYEARGIKTTSIPLHYYKKPGSADLHGREKGGDVRLAIENALPWSSNSHAKWLDANRKRRIDQAMFNAVKDSKIY